MLNLRDNKIISISIVIAFLMMTGIAVASPQNETLNVTWDGDGIKAEAWDFKEIIKEKNGHSDTKYFYYQIRYYQPGTFNKDHIYKSEGSTDNQAEPPYNKINNSNGFYVVKEKFEGNNSVYNLTNPWTEGLTSPDNGWVQGNWTVVLLKAGNAVNCPNCCNDCTGCCDHSCELANSYRINVPIYVPIPEFSTIALPIAAIIGIMFILQSRKRKED